MTRNPSEHPLGFLIEKLGMRLETHFVHNEIFKGQWGDEVHDAILHPEWQEKKAGNPTLP